MIDSFFKYFLQERYNPSQEFYRGKTSAAPKKYPRFPQIKLPHPEKLSESLEDTLNNRSSAVQFTTDPTSLQSVSTLLAKSVGCKNDRLTRGGALTRPHPSGGAKYPIEVYPVIISAKDIESGIYHYNSEDHVLEFLIQDEMEKILQCYAPYYEQARSANILLILSYVKGRPVPKYGGFAYKVGLIEGGHIGQNIYLVSNSLGFGCRAFGGGDAHTLNSILRLDGVNETVFYTLAIGGV